MLEKLQNACLVIVAVVTVAAIAAVLVLCGLYLYHDLQPAHGVIVRKEHEGEHWTTTYINTGGKTGGVLIPLTDHHPEEWHLLVRGTDGWNRRRDVSPDVFNAVNVGDRWDDAR